MMYTVKEAAEKLQLSPHSVRYYTDNALVPTLQRDRNNNRLFDDSAMSWLIGVKNLRNCGMSIDAIKAYVDLCLIGDETVPERYEILQEQKAVIDAQLEELLRSAQFLNGKIELYEQIMRGESEDTSNPDKW